MGTIDEALLFATRAHAGQVDKAGRPYIFHPVAVAEAVAAHGEVTMCAALLHDVVEDTAVTVEDVEEAFGVEVAEAVALLTKPERHEPGSPADDTLYDAYLDGICAHPTAAVVKLADLRHNLGRLEHLDETTAARLRAKYEPRVARLEAVVDAHP